MKKIIPLLCYVLSSTVSLGQSGWFTPYTDSVALVRDGNAIIRKMADRVQRINPKLIAGNTHAIKNTTPFLIYLDSLVVNLPMWTEVIPEQQAFFADVAGGREEGYKVFGLFFNGFYIAHEFGHSMVAASGKSIADAYASEYEANIIGILYWRSIGEKRRLRECYDYAKKMLVRLKNPVPPGTDPKQYITEHYYELAADPYQYGYIQFSQFVEIYENTRLPDFKNYIRSYQ